VRGTFDECNDIADLARWGATCAVGNGNKAALRLSKHPWPIPTEFRGECAVAPKVTEFARVYSALMPAARTALPAASTSL
jgi:hypothetical protein